MSRTFDLVFIDLIGVEGGYTTDSRDSGNWTGGKINSGVLRGTKYGISAAAFPTTNIPSLTLDQAKTIYKLCYWDKIRGDELPAPIAHITFDAAVNSGVSRGAKWLQAAVGVKADGIIGPVTLAAVNAAVSRNSINSVRSSALAERAIFMAGLSTFETYGRGWMRRLFGLAARSDTIAQAATASK